MIPNQLGFDENWSIIRNFAEYVAPALGWEPACPGALPTVKSCRLGGPVV